jgi:hypothetical protein
MRRARTNQQPIGIVRRLLGQLKRGFKTRALVAVIAVLVFGGAADNVQAQSWGTPGDGFSGSVQFTFSYASMWRMTERDESSAQLTTEINLDDGNRNFKDGRQVSNMLKVLGEFELRYDKAGTSFGLFTRGYGLNDWSIWNQRSDHNAPARNNSGAVYQGSLSPYNDGFTPEAQDLIGRRTQLLDAFVYVNAFQNSKHPVSFKLGQQVVNWGESLFIQNGILNALNPADVTRTGNPGTEIREILFPVNQAFASVGLSPSVSLSAYYQFEFQETMAPPPGSFFSSNDFVGPGAEMILLDIFEGALPIPFPPDVPQVSTLDRTDDIRPDDGGQWGVSLNWTVPALNYTDFGFYYLNYSSKLPQLGFRSALDGIANSPAFTPELLEMLGLPPVVAPWAADTSWYFLEYFDDVKLYGFSFNTTLPAVGIFDTAMSGEVAYHTDAPVQTIKADEGLKSMMIFGGPVPIMMPGQELHLATREEILTAQVTFNQKISAPKLADDITLLTEIGLVNTPNLSGDEVFRGPFDADDFAWGYRMKMINTWFTPFRGRTLSGTDLIGTISWLHDVKGYSAIPAGSFSGGSKAFGISLEAIWQQSFSVSLYYNAFWWDKQQIMLGDRDNAGFILKYYF